MTQRTAGLLKYDLYFQVTRCTKKSVSVTMFLDKLYRHRYCRVFSQTHISVERRAQSYRLEKYSFHGPPLRESTHV